MRKLLILFAACALVVAFTMPAIAKVHMGGILFTDVIWYSADQKYQQNTLLQANDEEFEQFRISVPVITRLYGKWTNKEGNVGLHIEVGMTGEGSPARQPDNTESVETRYAYGWWKINPTLKLTVGQGDEIFSKLKPAQLMGTDLGHIVGYGFGNVGQDREPRVQLGIKFSDAIGLDIAAVYPTQNGIGGGWAAADEESSMPKWEIMLTAKFGPVTIYPSYMSYSVEYERDAFSGAPAGAEDSIDCMGYSIPIKAGFGPIGIAAEYTYGENLADAGVGGGAGAAAWDAGNTKVVDAEETHWWVDLSFKFSKLASIHGIYGSREVDLDRAGTANDTKRERTMWGITLPLNVAKNFKITPNYFVYDYGDQVDAGVKVAELGEQTLWGVQFQITF